MPDAHAGFGMPIGGVLLTDGAVVPYAVGVDIGCGVALARTNLVWEESLTPEKLRAVLRQVARDVPTGFAVHPRAPMTADRMVELIGDDPPPSIAWAWIDRAALSLGTLGGGNHFLEVQCDDERRIHFMLHSGSRNLGKQVCDAFVKRARDACRSAHRGAAEPRPRVPALRHRPGRICVLGVDALGDGLGGAEPPRDDGPRRGGVPQGTPRSTGSSAWATSTTTTPRRRPTAAPRGSSTARAPSGPGRRDGLHPRFHGHLLLRW